MTKRALARRAAMLLAPALLAGVASAQSVFTFSLDGNQEVPPSGSPGTGTATVTLDQSSGAVTVNGTFSGLLGNITMAHIHGPAPVGMNAGILVTLQFTGTTSGTISGNGVFTPTQVTDMLCGLHYINIHSTVVGSGEIRGQVLSTPAVNVYGSGINPAGSMSVVSGSPAVGGSVTLGVDDPTGTLAPPGFSLLALSLAQDPFFAAGGTGLLLPGFGMSGPNGELLVGIGPGELLLPLLTGPPWAGAGSPASFPIVVPNDKTLVGVRLYAQGILVDASAKAGLADGAEIVFGL